MSGLEQHKRGHLTQAKRHFDQALEAQPNHFWAQCLLAICELNSRPAHPGEAKAHLTGCLQSHPELPWLYLLRGLASGQLGKVSSRAEAQALFDAAEADFREALKRDRAGRFRYALLANRGLVRFESRKLDLAIADLEEAIELDPRQLSAHVTLAQIHRQQHELDLALSELSRAIALEPGLAPLYRTRACWNLERPRVTPEVRAQVIADLEQAIRLDVPNSRELAKDHAEMGRLLLLDKQFQRALEACDAGARDRSRRPRGPPLARRCSPRALARERRDRGVRRLPARAVRRPTFSGCAGSPRPSAMTSPARSMTTRWHWLSSQDRPWCVAGGGGPISSPEPPNWHCAISRKSFASTPRSADAYSGRGSAHVALGHCRLAVADAEESLRHGESEARLLYSAARILALAAESAKEEPNRRALSDAAAAESQRERALDLLGQAVERTPPQERAAFWSNVVQSDHAFTAIRRHSAYARIGMAAALPRPR